MPIKKGENIPANNAAQQTNGTEHTEFEFRENPRINAQIDAYKKQFPKKWAFIKSMPRERLENALVLAKIRSFEQREKLDRGVLRKVENNEEFKKACDAVLQHFPEDQRQPMKVKMARDFVLSQSRQQKQNLAMAA